jgi:hypothetical protein
MALPARKIKPPSVVVPVPSPITKELPFSLNVHLLSQPRYTILPEAIESNPIVVSPSEESIFMVFALDSSNSIVIDVLVLDVFGEPIYSAAVGPTFAIGVVSVPSITAFDIFLLLGFL